MAAARSTRFRGAGAGRAARRSHGFARTARPARGVPRRNRQPADRWSPRWCRTAAENKVRRRAGSWVASAAILAWVASDRKRRGAKCPVPTVAEPGPDGDSGGQENDGGVAMDLKLAGKTALITGASKGIG